MRSQSVTYGYGGAIVHGSGQSIHGGNSHYDRGDVIVRIGILRFVLHRDFLRRLAQGWRYAADLGPYSGQFACLMWWCCGDCRDGEAP